jgi:hypothetical protein
MQLASLNRDVIVLIVSMLDNDTLLRVPELSKFFCLLCSLRLDGVWLARVECRLGYIPPYVGSPKRLFVRSLYAGSPRAWYNRELILHPAIRRRRDVVRVAVDLCWGTAWVAVVTVAGECYIADDDHCVCLMKREAIDCAIVALNAYIRVAVITPDALYLGSTLNENGTASIRQSALLMTLTSMLHIPSLKRIVSIDDVRANTAEVVCTLQDGGQLYVRYDCRRLDSHVAVRCR